MRTLCVEALEDRRLLSVVPALPANWQAQPTIQIVSPSAFAPSGSSTPNANALTPNQIRGAYGLGTYDSTGALSNAVMFGGIQGDGSGQTIAIVDYGDDPNAASDLNAFSAYFNLPQVNVSGGPTFQKLDETGGSNLPTTVPSAWTVEESLDIEWAHVMAPMANIILFEAADNDNGLFTAVQTAAATPGVVVVSMSWGGDEVSDETAADSCFTTPSGHNGVTFLAATGDYGAYSSDSTTTITPQYPASSPNVVAVGGTSLYVNGNSYASETAWGNGVNSGTARGGGGGISSYESQPSYQSGVVNAYSTTQRTYPDVSADADPFTGVPIYDSTDYGSTTPWSSGPVGGTSLACPLWAGMIAIADQGRSIAGLPSLDGPSQTLPTLYALPAADFNDIVYDTSTISTPDNTMPGPSIGPSPLYDPGPGYDLATGLGSPVGNVLIPTLAGPSMLAFAQGPTSALAGASIVPSITVDVENALGDIVISDNSDVTLSIGNNPAGGSLQGTLTVAAVDGVATFSGLDITAVGNGYTLVASDGGLAGATSAAFNIAPDPPTIATPAVASLDPVTGTTVGLSVLGADAAGESNLTYEWSTLPNGATPPTFSDNGDNTAKNTTATFSQAGNYVFTVTITDPAGLSTTSSVSVAVNQTLTSFSLAAAPGNGFNPDGADTFQATALDQFGMALANQPSPPWSLDNDGIDFNSTAGATVILDGVSPSFADVTFSGTGYTMVQQGSGGALLLANGNGAATLTAAAGEDTIGVPVVLQSNVVALPAAGSQLTVSGGISGPGQFTVDAPGNVIFTAANTYTGGTTVAAGTLTITTVSAIAADTSLTVNAGGVFIFDPAATATPSAAAVATATAAVSTNASIAAVDTPAAAAVSPVPAPAAVAIQPAAQPIAASPAAKSPDASDAHAAVISQFVGPLTAKPLSSLTLPRAGEEEKETASAKIAGNPAWAWLAAAGMDSSDWRQQKDVAISALDAVFADYGRAKQ